MFRRPRPRSHGLLMIIVSAISLSAKTSGQCLRDDKMSEAVLERHRKANHGDVCRVITTKAFFCPDGCEQVTGAPHCVAGEETGGSTALRPDTTAVEKPPCRVRQHLIQPTPPPSMSVSPRVSVKGLPATTSELFIKELFSHVGNVKQIALIRGETSSAAEVQYHDPYHAMAALKQFDGLKLPGGDPMIVSLIRSGENLTLEEEVGRTKESPKENEALTTTTTTTTTTTPPKEKPPPPPKEEEHRSAAAAAAAAAGALYGWVLGGVGESCSVACGASAGCDLTAMRRWVDSARGLAVDAASAEYGVVRCFRSTSVANANAAPIVFGNAESADCRSYVKGFAPAATTCDATMKGGRRLCVCKENKNENGNNNNNNNNEKEEEAAAGAGAAQAATKDVLAIDEAGRKLAGAEDIETHSESKEAAAVASKGESGKGTRRGEVKAAAGVKDHEDHEKKDEAGAVLEKDDYADGKNSWVSWGREQWVGFKRGRAL